MLWKTPPRQTVPSPPAPAACAQLDACGSGRAALPAPTDPAALALFSTRHLAGLLKMRSRHLPAESLPASLLPAMYQREFSGVINAPGHRKPSVMAETGRAGGDVLYCHCDPSVSLKLFQNRVY